MEVQSAFCLCRQSGIEFLAKFWCPDTSFKKNILTPLNLKFKTFAYAQIAITHYDILFINFLNLYEFETYIGSTFE